MGKAKRLHNASDKFPVDKPGIRVDVSGIAALLRRFTDDEHTSLDIAAIAFLERVNSMDSLSSQIKACQEFKSKFKPTLLSKPLPARASEDLFVLFYVYLSPLTAAIRGSLDWLIEASTQALYEDCLASIRCACVCVLADVSALLALPFTTVPLARVKETSYSILQMALIDKACRWMDEPPCFARMLSVVDSLFGSCASLLFPSLASSASDAMVVVTDAGVAYSEHSAECMKALSMMLRTRREAHLYASLESPEVLGCLERILAAAFTVLRSESINRDVVTSVAIGVVSVQHAYRNRGFADSTHLGKQLYAFLRCAALEPASVASPDEAQRAGVLASVCSALGSFPLCSRCEVFRACLSLYDQTHLLHQPENGHKTGIDAHLLFGYAFDAIMRTSSDSVTTTRFAGLQMLETWLNAVEQLEASHPFRDSNLYCDSMRPKLASISGLLTLVWSHPAKLISHIVPVVYQRLVDYLFKSRAMHLACVETCQRLIWGDLIRDALSQPTHHRGRYQAINILLPKVSTELLVLSQPSVVADLVHASSARDVSSASTKLLGTLLRFLRDREGYAESRVRALWMSHVARALCSSSRKTRKASADYLVPEMMQVDAACAEQLLDCIRSLPDAEEEDRLFAVLSVVLQCRLHNLAGQQLSEASGEEYSLGASGPLSLAELRWGCACGDVDVRLTALLLLVAGRTASPLQEHEWALLREYLPLSLKCAEADHRQRVLRVVKALVLRVKECVRVCARDSRKVEERVVFLEQQSDQAEGAACQRDALRKQLLELAQAEKSALCACEWLRDVCLNNCFPGASFDREIMALDVLFCVIEASERDSALLASFFSPALTRSVLNVFLSSWDKSRHLAADVLMKFPRPLPGYEDPASIAPLLQWAHTLTGSARQRESDAGSQILRVVYEVYAVDQRSDVRFALDPLSPGTPRSEAFGSAHAFFEDLLSTVEARLDRVNGLFAQLSVDPSAGAPAVLLSHGLLLGVRYCIGSTSKSIRAATAAQVASWRALIGRALGLAFRAMSMGVSVVAEAPSDVDFAPHLASTLGPVNANSYMFLNTNSFFGATGLGEPEDDSSNRELQRAVVGAWLLVKESSALLSRLIEASVKLAEESGISVLDDESIDRVGMAFIDALGRLKHMGAISEVHASLQKVSETLLRHSFSSPSLCAMPLRWLHALLDKLESRQQVFILRRSSGFAYSFLSLLRAEVSDARPTLLTLAMAALLRHASEYAHCPADDGQPEGESEGWRKSVHALNILRLVLLDSTLGPNLGPYVAPATEVAVNGFKSSLWAIRNSSMMVFAAVVQRAVANEKNDFSNIHSSSPSDFFNNYPSLFAFLLRELAAVHDTDGANALDERRQLDLLYPLLLLLSKLRPVASEEDEGGGRSHDYSVDLKAFLEPIERCQGMSNMLVRSVAAKALKSFVSVDKSPARALAIMRALETQVRAGGAGMNEVHGRLAAVLELLESCYSAGRAPSRAVVSSEVLPAAGTLLLALYAWLPFCPPVLLLALRIAKGMDAYLSCAASKELLCNHVVFCLDTLLDPGAPSDSQALPYGPSMQSACVEELVVMHLDESPCAEPCALCVRRLLSLDALLALLQHSVAEVREGVLVGLARVSASHLASHQLLDALFAHLAQETQPPLVERCAALLSDIAAADAARSADRSFYPLFRKLSGLLFEGDGVLFFDYGLQRAADFRLRNTDAACCAYSILVWYLTQHGTADSVESVLRVLEAACEDDRPDRMRLAAARSWAPLLSLVRALLSGSAARACECRLLLAAVSLLQDDDEDVRDATIGSLQASADGSSGASGKLLVEALAMGDLQARLVALFKGAGVAVMQAEAVAVVEHYQRYLGEGDGGDSQGSDDDALAQIFEEEVCNLYKESRSVFDCLGGVLGEVYVLALADPSSLAADMLASFLLKALAALASYQEQRARGGWLCDVSYRKDLFSSLYGCTHALRCMLCSAAPLSEDGRTGLLDEFYHALQSLGGDVGAMHPLVASNLDQLSLSLALGRRSSE